MEYEVGNTFDYLGKIYEIIGMNNERYFLKDTCSEVYHSEKKEAFAELVQKGFYQECMYDKGGSRYSYD